MGIPNLDLFKFFVSEFKVKTFIETGSGISENDIEKLRETFCVHRYDKESWEAVFSKLDAD